MKVPKHVKYLSILFFLNAGIAFVISGLTLISTFLARTVGARSFSEAVIQVTGMGWGFGLNSLLTILSIGAFIFLGVSLRQLRPWARTITLIYCIFTLLLSLLNSFTGDGIFSFHFFVQIYAVYVLLRLDVKEAFQAGPDQEDNTG